MSKKINMSLLLVFVCLIEFPYNVYCQEYIKNDVYYRKELKEANITYRPIAGFSTYATWIDTVAKDGIVTDAIDYAIANKDTSLVIGFTIRKSTYYRKHVHTGTTEGCRLGFLSYLDMTADTGKGLYKYYSEKELKKVNASFGAEYYRIISMRGNNRIYLGKLNHYRVVTLYKCPTLSEIKKGIYESYMNLTFIYGYKQMANIDNTIKKVLGHFRFKNVK